MGCCPTRGNISRRFCPIPSRSSQLTWILCEHVATHEQSVCLRRSDPVVAGSDKVGPEGQISLRSFCGAKMN
jgi:hypothetical protein